MHYQRMGMACIGYCQLNKNIIWLQLWCAYTPLSSWVWFYCYVLWLLSRMVIVCFFAVKFMLFCWEVHAAKLNYWLRFELEFLRVLRSSWMACHLLSSPLFLWGSPPVSSPLFFMGFTTRNRGETLSLNEGWRLVLRVKRTRVQPAPRASCDRERDIYRWREGCFFTC